MKYSYVKQSSLSAVDEFITEARRLHSLRESTEIVVIDELGNTDTAGACAVRDFRSLSDRACSIAWQPDARARLVEVGLI